MAGIDTPYHSYEKIAESTRAWGLDEAGERELERATWVVTEKIHGANFCLVTDGWQVRAASRRGLLEPDEPFFGYQRLVERLRDRVRAAWSARRTNDARLWHLAIYGELFGGGYPHPDVPPDPQVQPVQTGVFYAPSVEFCVFDIAAEYGGFHTYLDYEETLALCREAGLMAAEPLLRGSYAAALAYPVGFETTIPARLGLPRLAEPNLAEGVVLKPIQPLMFRTPRGPVRPVLKKKIPQFAEDRRYSAAQKWTPPRPSGELAGLALLEWQAYNLVTENRLRSVVSKLGPGRPRDGRHAQRLFRAMFDDIMDQVREEHGALVRGLSSAEYERLRLFIEAEIRVLFKTVGGG